MIMFGVRPGARHGIAHQENELHVRHEQTNQTDSLHRQEAIARRRLAFDAPVRRLEMVEIPTQVERPKEATEILEFLVWR